jgi:pimeloyl-ACP methyl ester carboxylesterase
MRLSVLGAAFAASVLIASAAGARPAPEEHDVPVAAEKLHLVVHRGEGAVVVFEAGAGADQSSWSSVVKALLPRTPATLVAYDRAGRGKSDPLPTSYDIYEEAARLHKALYRLGLEKHLYLVGHSYGGFLIQIYANLYPEDVRGLVYVDANTVAGVGGIEGAKSLIAGVTPEMRKAKEYDARQNDVFLTTMATMQNNPAPCGLPITVISQGKGDLLDIEPHWFEGHAALAARTGAVAIRAPESGHLIPVEAPNVVADAVLAQLQSPGPAARLWFNAADVDCGAKP